jgi:hypothetical protein
LSFPSFLKEDFREIVRDHEALYLRAACLAKTKGEPVYVISSEPLDKALMGEIATNLGEITLYEPVQRSAGQPSNSHMAASAGQKKAGDSRELAQTFTAGTVPPSDSLFDREITFGTPLSVVDWTGSTGERQQAGALVRVQTRPSVLYDRLFEALGDLARGVEYILLVVAIVFAIIELLALFIGTRLTLNLEGGGAIFAGDQHIVGHLIITSKSVERSAGYLGVLQSTTASTRS